MALSSVAVADQAMDGVKHIVRHELKAVSPKGILFEQELMNRDRMRICVKTGMGDFRHTMSLEWDELPAEGQRLREGLRRFQATALRVRYR